MINLLMEKLEAVEKLKDYTKEIMSLSPKTDDEKINIMIEERQKYVESINIIDDNINNYIKSYEDNYEETNDVKNLKNSIKESIKEIIEMDKEIRNKINNELKNVKDKLNQPKTNSKIFNVKI